MARGRRSAATAHRALAEAQHVDVLAGARRRIAQALDVQRPRVLVGQPEGHERRVDDPRQPPRRSRRERAGVERRGHQVIEPAEVRRRGRASPPRGTGASSPARWPPARRSSPAAARSSGWNGSASSPERLMVTTPRTRSPMISGWAIACRIPWAMNSGRASGRVRIVVGQDAAALGGGHARPGCRPASPGWRPGPRWSTPRAPACRRRPAGRCRRRRRRAPERSATSRSSRAESSSAANSRSMSASTAICRRRDRSSENSRAFSRASAALVGEAPASRWALVRRRRPARCDRAMPSAPMIVPLTRSGHGQDRALARVAQPLAQVVGPATGRVRRRRCRRPRPHVPRPPRVRAHRCPAASRGRARSVARLCPPMASATSEPSGCSSRSTEERARNSGRTLSTVRPTTSLTSRLSVRRPGQPRQLLGCLAPPYRLGVEPRVLERQRSLGRRRPAAGASPPR